MELVRSSVEREDEKQVPTTQNGKSPIQTTSRCMVFFLAYEPTLQTLSP